MIQASRLELRSASLILDHDLVPASCGCRGRIISMSLRRGGESYHKGRKDSHEVRQSQRCKIVSALFHSPSEKGKFSQLHKWISRWGMTYECLWHSDQTIYSHISQDPPIFLIFILGLGGQFLLLHRCLHGCLSSLLVRRGNFPYAQNFVLKLLLETTFWTGRLQTTFWTGRLQDQLMCTSYGLVAHHGTIIANGIVLPQRQVPFLATDRFCTVGLVQNPNFTQSYRSLRVCYCRLVLKANKVKVKGPIFPLVPVKTTEKNCSSSSRSPTSSLQLLYLLPKTGLRTICMQLYHT